MKSITPTDHFDTFEHAVQFYAEYYRGDLSEVEIKVGQPPVPDGCDSEVGFCGQYLITRNV